jgi:hypothetical protein
LLKGQISDTLRTLIGGHFSIVNARAVHSLTHDNDGEGQQGFHKDGCPNGIIRGLIYLTDVDENSGPFGYLPDTDETKEVTVTGKPGAVFLFNADAVRHRATPPRTRERIAIDLTLLLHPPSCEPIAHSRVNFTWPLDPYMFSLTDKCYPPSNSGRWFQPQLIIAENKGAVKTLTAEQMAPSAPSGN